MKIGLALLLLLVTLPGAALAQEVCFCLRCTIGTHRSFSPATEAMLPTVARGQCTVSERALSGVAEPGLGDVVLAHDPSDGRIALLRVVALGGQQVQMVAGALMIDGVAVPRTPLPPLVLRRRADATGALPTCPEGTAASAETCAIPQAVEVLPNGHRYRVLNLRDDHPRDTTAAIEVPEGHLFLLGDHRDLALDSRTPPEAGGLGPVPLGQILGILETPAPRLAPE